MATELKFKTWLERMEANRFDDWTKENMVNEMPHTYFPGYLPLALMFLQGRFVDLGFENLGLSPQEHREILMAFGGTGVVIPGTQFRMRFAYPHAEIEPLDGSETATLPPWWKEGVLVIDDLRHFRPGSEREFARSNDRLRPAGIQGCRRRIDAALSDTLEIESEQHPLAKHAGMLPDDELTNDWEAAMAEYRRKIDVGPETS